MADGDGNVASQQPTTPQAPLVPTPPQADNVDVISPEGQHGTIPRANLSTALGRGFKQAVYARSPEGQGGWLPSDPDSIKKARARNFQFGPSAQLGVQAPAAPQMQEQTGLTSGPTPFITPAADWMSRYAQQARAEAQRHANYAWGPEAQSSNIMSPGGLLRRVGHAVMSPVAETDAALAGIGSGLLSDPKAQVAMGAGLVDPAIPGAYFAEQGLAGATGIGTDRPSSVAQAYQNPTPENVQQALFDTSMAVAPLGEAGAPPEAGAAPAPSRAGTAYQLGKAGAQSAISALPESLRQAAADRLRQSGSEQIQRVLGPTTRENKAIAQQIAPEIAGRGIFGWTRKGLLEQAQGQAEDLGQKIDDYYQSLPEGTTVPTQPILDHFEDSKNAFKGSNGEINDQGAIDTIDGLKKVVQQYGSDIGVNDLVKLRRLWDKQVAQGKGFFGKTLAEGSLIDAKRDAAGSIREELAKDHPDLAAINKEFSFWANIRKVLGDTVERKGSQAPPLGETLWSTAGMVKAGATGAAALWGLRKALTSTAWGTTAAAMKFKIADLLADGDVAGASRLASQATAAAGPAGPVAGPISQTGAPPSAAAAAAGAGGQGNLQLGMTPSATSGFPEAAVTPGPNAPSWTSAGQGRLRMGETPTPAEKAPAAVPESPQTPPQALTATPEQKAQQAAAEQQAIAHVNNGVTDRETHAPLREQAYVPELEPENLHGISQEHGREGQRGLTTKEAYQVNGKYTAERQALHDRIVEQILGPPHGEDAKPVVIFQGGGAASGKTESVGKALEQKYPGIAVADADKIKFGAKEGKGGGFGGAAIEGLPEGEIFKQSDPLGAAARLHEESSDIAKQIQKEAFRRKQSLIIDSVGGNAKKIGEQIPDLQQKGYRVEAHYADKPTETALKSMATRFQKTRRWVPPDIMADGHRQAADAYHKIAPLADEATLNIANPKGAEDVNRTTYSVAHRQGPGYNEVLNPVLYEKHLAKGRGEEEGLNGRNGLQGRQLDGGGPEGVPRSAGGGGSQGEAAPREPGSVEAGRGAAAAGAGAAPAAPEVTRLAGQDGTPTSVLTPTGNQLNGRYRVVEGDTLTPSHDPNTFAKNPNYPEGVQERAYHSSKEAQNRVIQQAQNYDPRYVVSDDPTGVNGPPVITPDGTVLGGNSRAMSTQRLYQGGGGDLYKNYLMQNASRFGLDPEQIRGMKNPQLVREIDAPGSADELRRIGKDLNRSPSGALGTSERAVSAGKSLRPESLQQISQMQNELGDDSTLRDLMGKRGKQVLDIMQRDGLVSDRERPGLVDTSTGGLNEDGKNLVEKALLGHVVDDPDLMDRTPKNVLNKVGSSLGDLASLGGRGDEYNILPMVREALRLHADAAQKGGPLEDYLNQRTMFGGERPKAIETLARALGGPAKSLKESLRSFANDARADVAGQGNLGLMGKPSAVDAFNHAFGTKLTEEEFHQALGRSSDETKPARNQPGVTIGGPAHLPGSLRNK